MLFHKKKTINVVMCCWKRLYNLDKQIQCLNSQTVSNQIVLHLLNNNQENVDRLENVVRRYNNTCAFKVKLSHYKNEFGPFQKFFYVRDNIFSRYVIFVDDDQLFEDDWFEKLYALRKAKTIFSWYGKVWGDFKHYWKGSIIRPADCIDNRMPHITEYHYGGGGGCVIDTSIFVQESDLFKMLETLPEQYLVDTYFADDTWLSYVLSKQQGWEIKRSFLPPILCKQKRDNDVSIWKNTQQEKIDLFDYLWPKWLV